MDQAMDIDERSISCEEARTVDQVRELAFQFALRKTDYDTASDIAQEVAIDCLLRLRRNRWRVVKSQRALVASMTRNKLSTLKERKKNRREREEQFMAERSARCPEWMNPVRGCEQREEERIRAQALEELPLKCRSAFLLVRDGGVSRREAARKLGISFGLVVNHVARAERHLADRLINVRPWNSTPPTLLKQSWSTQTGHRCGANQRLASRSKPLTEEDHHESTMNHPCCTTNHTCCTANQP